MKLTIVELDCNGDGIDFWKHAHYRLKIDGKIVSHSANAYDTLECIEKAMMAKSYGGRMKNESATS